MGKPDLNPVLESFFNPGLWDSYRLRSCKYEFALKKIIRKQTTMSESQRRENPIDLAPSLPPQNLQILDLINAEELYMEMTSFQNKGWNHKDELQ